MAPIVLDRTIKASHSPCEISKVRLFSRTPPVVDNWDPHGVGVVGVTWPMCYTSVNADRGEKKEMKYTPLINQDWLTSKNIAYE